MTTGQAKALIGHPDKELVLAALALVNLGDEEFATLNYRFMRKHTQEWVAEALQCSVMHTRCVEHTALKKCVAVWKNCSFLTKMASDVSGADT